MDYLTRQLLLQLIKLQEAYQKQSGAIDSIQKENHQHNQTRNEQFEQFLSTYKKLEGDKAENDEGNSKIQSSIRYATWIAAISALLAFGSAAVYARITYKMWEQMETQTTTAKQQLVLSTRPWLRIELSSAGPITFDKNGMGVAFSFTINNVGHSPATNVEVRPQLLNSQGSDDLLAVKNCIDQEPINVPPNISWGSTIFPSGTPTTANFSRGLSDDEINKTFIGFPKGVVLPKIAGCVDYTFGYPPKHHQTAFCYALYGISPLGKTIPLVNGTNLTTQQIRFISNDILCSTAN